MKHQEKKRTKESSDHKSISAETPKPLEGSLVSPELAIYAVVMEKVLSDPRMEAAFFGLSQQKKTAK